MGSLRRHEGYLMIDNREGPGISREFIMRTAPEKAAEVAGAGPGRLFEAPTLTCAHCSVQVILRPDRTRDRHYCQKCDHYVCDRPSCVLECRPFAQVLDAAYNAAARASGHPILVDPAGRLIGSGLDG